MYGRGSKKKPAATGARSTKIDRHEGYDRNCLPLRRRVFFRTVPLVSVVLFVIGIDLGRCVQ